ncbi:hypothetical protein [Curtobacterium sp. MCJR17_043]|uniref:hypothetical protein n=1 Tax=Curtobacterium sp. MCJR17_043 TaxID=2175660 RepID=UPI0024DF6FEC|nr:hypothetical protein [Curtobacterium sp. MCJR17_043]WIB36016.1 hypothetical protein DEJ15_01630 [Curtobacterium sp. MCJR17_043]
MSTGTDFRITILDGSGGTWSTAASAVNPLAVNRMPGGTNTTLNKIVLQQLTIPTASMTGLDLTDVREVRFTAGVGADGTGTGGVYLSDLAFDTPSVGTAVAQTRTTVNVAPHRGGGGRRPRHRRRRRLPVACRVPSGHRVRQRPRLGDRHRRRRHGARDLRTRRDLPRGHRADGRQHHRLGDAQLRPEGERHEHQQRRHGRVRVHEPDRPRGRRRHGAGEGDRAGRQAG